jgi:hypothetical protein
LTAPKKKKAAPKTAPKAAARPVDPEAALPSLTQDEMMQLRLLDAHARLADQEARLALMERAAYIARIDPQGKIEAYDSRARQAREQENLTRKDYRAVLAAASARLGIDLSVGCTIHPETGKIIQHAKKE